jgi:hypothetical protein
MMKHALIATLIVANVASITHHACAQTKRVAKSSKSIVITSFIFERIAMDNYASNACNDRAFEIVTRRANDAQCVALTRR